MEKVKLTEQVETTCGRRVDLKLTNGIVELTVSNYSLFSFRAVKTNLGWHNMMFATAFNNLFVRSLEAVAYERTHHSQVIHDRIGRGVELVITLSGRRGYPDEEYRFWMYAGLPVLILQHNVVNSTRKSVTVDFTVDFATGDDGRLHLPASGQLKYFHTQNIKKAFEKYNYDRTAPVMDGVIFRNIGFREVVGDAEDQPFPGLVIFDAKTGEGVIDAVLTQERCYRVLEFGQTGENALTRYTPRMEMRGIPHTLLKPGGILTGEKIYLEIGAFKNAYSIFDNYLDVFSKMYTYRAKTTSLKNTVMWGSWSFGTYLNINEKLIIRNADYIKRHFPSVKWMYIDNGYSRHPMTGADFAYEDKNHGINRDKFPHGMKSVADEIKKRGLRPAIWFGLTVFGRSRLARQHPEWLLRKKDGQLFESGFGGYRHFLLDPSVPEVRNYLDNTFRLLIREWGFEGIKLDMWTFVFEDNNIRYRYAGRSSLELRNWLLKTIRSYLPEDGYIQAGTHCPMGNPFLGIYMDNYRYGPDIGEENIWETIMACAKSMTALNITGGNRLFLMNSDAIGIMPKLKGNERRVWFALCYMTGSALEIAGDLPEYRPEAYEDVKKVIDRPNNGAKIFWGDFDIKDPSQCIPPRIWYCRPQHGTGMVAAVFNWGENPVKVLVDLGKLGIEQSRIYEKIDFWSGERIKTASKASIEVNPRDVKLFYIKNQLQKSARNPPRPPACIAGRSTAGRSATPPVEGTLRNSRATTYAPLLGGVREAGGGSKGDRK